MQQYKIISNKGNRQNADEKNAAEYRENGS